MDARRLRTHVHTSKDAHFALAHALFDKGERPDWHADAECRDRPDAAFFTPNKERTPEQRTDLVELCARCAARPACRRDVLNREEKVYRNLGGEAIIGFVAGMTAAQRRDYFATYTDRADTDAA